MKKKSKNSISEEVLAAFLDGNATAQECSEVLQALADDDALRELLHISQQVDADFSLTACDNDILPMAAMAATCSEANYCSIECEKYILRSLNIEYDEQQLLAEAIEKGWQQEAGTALHNVGRHLESKGLYVTRQYKTTIDDIANALAAGNSVIVAVDGGELLKDRREEALEDILIGPQPDHTVVVLSYDAPKGIITLYDPNSSQPQDTYCIEQFLDAWSDSQCYLLTISLQATTYTPHPVDLSDVELPDNLKELREALAENAHDVWAAERQAQGWTYGPHRNDATKQTPCMLPYSQLPESEKKFDRDMAMNTLKLLTKLGYDIVKRK